MLILWVYTQVMKITRVTQSKIGSVDFNDLPFGRICSDHMYIAEYANGEWGPGEIKPLENFSIHPANLTLHYGQSIFEGMKASKHHDGTPMLFRVDKHIERLNNSAVRMCMPEVPAEMFSNAVRELVSLESAWIPPQEGSALYIRPFMFATEEFVGVRASATYKFVIFTCPVGPYYSKPVSLLADSTYVRACPGGIGEAKTAGNYAASLYPAQKAKEAGYDQIMWMDPFEFKYIQEVGTMNIFFIIGDKAYTPAINGAILKGITRDSMIHAMRDRGIEVIEKNLSIDEVIEASRAGKLQEVFGTGTAAVVSLVHKIAYKDTVIELNPENYQIAPSLKKYIDGMRVGTIDDKFGWTERVVEAVMS